MKYSFILEIDDISKDGMNDFISVLANNHIKFHVLKSDKELKENQKYKEVINKIKYICDKVPNDWTLCGIDILHNIENILKEVEHE